MFEGECGNYLPVRHLLYNFVDFFLECAKRAGDKLWWEVLRLNDPDIAVSISKADNIIISIALLSFFKRIDFSFNLV